MQYYQSHAWQRQEDCECCPAVVELPGEVKVGAGQGRCAGHSPDGCLVINNETCRVLLPLLVLIPIPGFALMFEQSLRKA